MKQLQTANSDKLYMLAILDGSFETEKQLHKKFRNVSHEWFSAFDEALLLFINENNKLNNYVEIVDGNLMVYKKIGC